MAYELTSQYCRNRRSNVLLLTVALKLMPMVLMRTASELCAKTKNTQNSDVTKVLPASDHLRPTEESTRYAPSCGRLRSAGP